MPISPGSRIRHTALTFFACAVVALQPICAHAADKKADTAAVPDVIVFTNGDQLSGKLLRVVDGTVTFHSDIAGDISVTQDKIKSLRSSQQFAVIRKEQKVGPKTPPAEVPQGPVSIADGAVSVSSGSGQAAQIPLGNANYLIDEKTFQTEVIHEPSFFYGWAGAVTLGATLVQATQTSQTLTGSATLARIIPSAEWLNPRNKTLFNLNATYGLLRQPFIPGVQAASSAKTNILHGDAERDEYFSPRFYGLVDASADHNIGSGLQLQQIYGGGAGWTILKQPRQQFDVKGDIHYEQQQFYAGIDSPNGTPNVNIIGASITEEYLRKLPRGLLFNESATITPAFNVPSAYSALALANLSFPVYKRLSFTLASQDNFLNDPPLGFRKNTFQFTAGVTYALK